MNENMSGCFFLNTVYRVAYSPPYVVPPSLLAKIAAVPASLAEPLT